MPLPRAAVDIWLQGSSLTWPCSKSNCYKVPLGFVGQAVIIACELAVAGRPARRGGLAAPSLTHMCQLPRQARQLASTQS